MKHEGHVIWLTGLSGAGKSTIASAMAGIFRAMALHVLILDGDEIRDAIRDLNCGHDLQSRLDNAYRISRLAKLAADQDHVVIVATMSMFHEIHDWNRQNLPGYFEVYLHVEPKILRMRDPKGLYKKIDDGLEKNMPGVDITPELPKNPDLFLDNNLHAPKPIEQANKIIAAWEGRAGVKL